MKAKIKEILAGGVRACVSAGLLPETDLPDWSLDPPKSRQHGDYATNLAFLLAPTAKKSPRQIAELLVGHLPPDPGAIAKIEVAGPGFINIFVTDALRHKTLGEILDQGTAYGRSESGQGRRVQVEFVSANPTGPLTIGHGRQAVLGDAIARLLERTGHKVTREYYFNDAGRQMNLLAESTRARYLELLGREAAFPEDGYHGEYIRQIAARIVDREGEGWTEAHSDRFKEFAEEALFTEIRGTLDRIGIVFDVYFNETSLYEDGSLDAVLAALREKGLCYEKEGAVWFRGTRFGLDKDRVLVKSTGEPTYRLPDIAYHVNKLRRGFDGIVDIFGADHESTCRDVLAALGALGYDVSRIRILIHQFVTLLRDGRPVRMGKRSANFVTLEELLDEAGADAVRFFFLQRRHDAHLDFDLDLARRQTDENPVYYVQYAHARIASVLREAVTKGARVPAGLADAGAERLTQEPERDLIHRMAEFPELVERAASSLEPHRITFYLLDLVGAFHAYYNQHRILSEEASITSARLALIAALRHVIAAGLALMGVSAPDRMERPEVRREATADAI